jgi:hypothetical protein
MNDIPRPRFDPTVNLGHVLSILSFVGMAVAAYYAMKGDIDKLESRMVTVERTAGDVASSVSRLTDVVVITARQDERLNALGARVDRIERMTRSQ